MVESGGELDRFGAADEVRHEATGVDVGRREERVSRVQVSLVPDLLNCEANHHQVPLERPLRAVAILAHRATPFLARSRQSYHHEPDRFRANQDVSGPPFFFG